MAKTKTTPKTVEAKEKEAHKNRVNKRWFAAATLIVVTWIVFGVLILKLIDTINVLEEKLVDIADYQSFQERIDKIQGHVEAMHNEQMVASPNQQREEMDPVTLPAELPAGSDEPVEPEAKKENDKTSEQIDSLSEKIHILEAQLSEQQQALEKQQNEAFAKLMMVPSRIKTAINENEDLSAFKAKLGEIRDEMPELSDEVARLEALIEEPIANSHDLRSRFVKEVKETYHNVKTEVAESSTWQKVKDKVNEHISIKDLNNKDATDTALDQAEQALDHGDVDKATNALKGQDVPEDAKSWFEDAETYNEVKKLLDDIQIQLQQALGDKA